MPYSSIKQTSYALFVPLINNYLLNFMIDINSFRIYLCAQNPVEQGPELIVRFFQTRQYYREADGKDATGQSLPDLCKISLMIAALKSRTGVWTSTNRSTF
jgi:hypothetical protein